MDDIRRERYLMLATLLLVSGWSGYQPAADRFTWLLETLPIYIALPLLLLTHRRYPLTRLTHALLWCFALILLVGGHYTYAEVPAFNWLRDTFALSRNHFDRVGHFFQGLAPALLVREILLRNTPLTRGGWLFFVVSCVALAISACYEFIEWWTAALTGEAASAFLGTQGDVWDSQWDMFLALTGAILGQLLFGHIHDKQLIGIDATLFLRKVRC